MAQTVKNLPARWETQVQSLGGEDPLEKEMATHPVFLPGESHGQRSLAGYKSTGLQKSQTPLSDQHFNFQKRKLNDLSEVKSGCDTQDWARGPLSSWPRPSQEQGRPGQAAPQSPAAPRPDAQTHGTEGDLHGEAKLQSCTFSWYTTHPQSISKLVLGCSYIPGDHFTRSLAS